LRGLLNNMYTIKELTNVGNPDFGQDPGQLKWGTTEYKNISRDTVEELRGVVAHYIADNELGGGNFMFPTVYEDQKPIGYISYNLRFHETDDMPSCCT
jgi:hypothetical protein